MALQFSSSIKTLYAQVAMRGFGNLFATNSGISIYSGVQPAASALIANWNTQYRLDIQNSAHLAFYTNTVWTRTNSTITMTTFPSDATPARAGTASWAVVWQASVVTNASHLSQGSPPSLSFVIVPVTTTAGNGVIRFTSLNFTPTAPVTLIDAGFTIL
jgi:hypothetical protein